MIKLNKQPKKPAKLPPGVRERDGRYTYRYSIEVVVDGIMKRKQKETRSYSTAKEAYDAGILIEADKQRGKHVDEKNITLEKWVERWLRDYKIERDPRPTTLRNRTTAFSAIQRYLGKNTRMKDITTDDYQQFLNKLKIDNKKELTIREYHSSCTLLFADAVRKRIIGEDPAKDGKVPVFKKTLEQSENEDEVPLFLEKEQLKHLLRIIRFRGKPQEHEIFTVLAYTGLRIGELLALKVGDFNEQEKTISITKTLTVLTKVTDYHLGPPKSKSSKRIVSIGETAIKAIKSQLRWRIARIEDELAQHDSEFIFWSSDKFGYPASARYLQQRFDDLLKIAKLPESLTPHSLRHTHVSLLAEAGEDLAVIQARLGHKNDEMTQRVYLHVTEKRKKAAADVFEKVMRS